MVQYTYLFIYLKDTVLKSIPSKNPCQPTTSECDFIWKKGLCRNSQDEALLDRVANYLCLFLLLFFSMKRDREKERDKHPHRVFTSWLIHAQPRQAKITSTCTHAQHVVQRDLGVWTEELLMSFQHCGVLHCHCAAVAGPTICVLLRRLYTYPETHTGRKSCETWLHGRDWHGTPKC